MRTIQLHGAGRCRLDLLGIWTVTHESCNQVAVTHPRAVVILQTSMCSKSSNVVQGMLMPLSTSQSQVRTMRITHLPQMLQWWAPGRTAFSKNAWPVSELPALWPTLVALVACRWLPAMGTNALLRCLRLGSRGSR